MRETDLLRELRRRCTSEQAVARPPAELGAVAEAERVLGFRLPRLYVRLLTEVANGGFGPGQGVIGIPPAYVDEDRDVTLTELYLEGRACEDWAWRTPKGILPLCDWGYGTISHIDAFTPAAAVLTSNDAEQGTEYVVTAPNLSSWLSSWLAGDDLEAATFESVGHRDIINPFTNKPIRLPKRRLRGSPVDLSGRR